MLCEESRAQQKEDSFASKDQANKFMNLYLLQSSQILFSSVKVFFFPCCEAISFSLALLWTVNYNSLLIPNKSFFFFFWINIWQSMCFRSAVWWALLRSEKTPEGPRLVSRQVQYWQLSLGSLFLLPDPEFEGISFSWFQTHELFAFEALQGLFRMDLFMFFKMYLFVSFWLCLVFAAAHGLSLVVASGGHSPVAVQASHYGGFSYCRAQASGMWISIAVTHGLHCSVTGGVFLIQGLTCIPYIGKWILNLQTSREAWDLFKGFVFLVKVLFHI